MALLKSFWPGCDSSSVSCVLQFMVTDALIFVADGCWARFGSRLKLAVYAFRQKKL